MFHTVFQFPDVAGPGVVKYLPHGLGAEVMDDLALRNSKAVQKVAGPREEYH